MILDDNLMIAEGLPGTVARGMDPADLEAYLQPYPARESRRPLLQWPRAMPLGGEPADIVARVEAYGAWLAASADIPKLLIEFAPGPGVMMGPALLDWCMDHIAGLEVERHDLPAGHHTPEDRPAEIAAAVSGWVDRHGLRWIAYLRRGLPSGVTARSRTEDRCRRAGHVGTDSRTSPDRRPRTETHRVPPHPGYAVRRGGAG